VVSIVVSMILYHIVCMSTDTVTSMIHYLMALIGNFSCTPFSTEKTS